MATSALPDHVDTTNTTGLEEGIFHVYETFFASFLITTLLVSAWVMNGLIAVMFVKKPELRNTPSNKLVLNLIATNSIGCVFLFPSILTSAISQSWVLGDVGCQIFGIVETAVFSSWLITLASLSIDRFHFIVNPLTYPVNMTIFKTNVILCLLWIYSIVTSIMPLFVAPAFQYHTLEHSCTINWNKHAWYSVHLLVTAYLMPLLVQIWCYMHIVLAAKRQAKFGRRLSRVAVVPLQVARIIRETSATRAIKKTVLVLGSFILIFTPYSIYVILRTTGTESSFWGFWLHLLSLTATIVYPILFVLRAKGLKKEFREILRFLKPTRNRIHDVESVHTKHSYDRGRTSTRLMLFSSSDIGMTDAESSSTHACGRRRSVASERRVSWNLQPSYMDDEFSSKNGRRASLVPFAGAEASEYAVTTNTFLPGQVSDLGS